MAKHLRIFLRSIPAYGFYLAAEEKAKGIDNPFFQSIGEKLFDRKKDTAAGASTVGELIVVIIQILLLVAASIAIIFLIFGGYRYITAHGNEEAAEAAKKTMKGAIVGLVIVILSFAIVAIITRVLLEAPIPGTGIQ